MQIKFPKFKRSFKKGGIHNSPDIYWDIIQLVSLLIILASMVYGFFLFRTINDAFNQTNNNVSDKNTAVNKDRIESALKVFEIKEKTSLDIINSPSPIIDPSR
jgi:hypothetical protein